MRKEMKKEINQDMWKNHRTSDFFLFGYVSDILMGILEFLMWFFLGFIILFVLAVEVGWGLVDILKDWIEGGEVTKETERLCQTCCFNRKHSEREEIFYCLNEKVNRCFPSPNVLLYIKSTKEYGFSCSFYSQMNNKEASDE